MVNYTHSSMSQFQERRSLFPLCRNEKYRKAGDSRSLNKGIRNEKSASDSSGNSSYYARIVLDTATCALPSLFPGEPSPSWKAGRLRAVIVIECIFESR
jgi:hypothetical protein